jgi:biopolymer transport protein ExbD
MRARGATISPADYVAKVRQETLALAGDAIAVKVAADQALPAERLLEIVGELRDAGASRVTMVTEREMP